MHSPQKTDTSAQPSPLYVQAQKAFYRDLSELLKTRCGQWVAYRGDQLVGFARDQTELYERCVRQGFDADEFVVLFADHAALADHDVIDLPLAP